MTSQQQHFLNCVEAVYESLERFALSLTQNREEARELLCETVAAAYERFDALQHEQAFLSYMFSIASRTFYRRLGQRKRYELISVQEIDELYAGGILPDDALDIQFLYEAIAKLPPEYREVIVMAEIAGLSHKDIAQATGMSIANIKIRVFRAKKKLKALLTTNADNENADEEAEAVLSGLRSG